MKFPFSQILSSIFFKYPSQGQEQARIFNGTEVEVDRYDYTVALRGYFLKNPTCGGSLIAPGYILSHPFCFPAHQALIGAVDVSDSSSEEYESINIEYAVIHPDFDEYNFENAIAVFKLAEDSTFTPVTLNTDGSEDTGVGTNVTVLGWGNTEYFSEGDPSDVLREGTTEIVSNEDCEDAWSSTGYSVTDSMMCGSTSSGNGLFCRFDGGGPVLIKGSNSTSDIQVGLINNGQCGDENYPDVYIKVDEYADFIECVTNGGSNDCGSVFESDKLFSFLDMIPTPIATVIFFFYFTIYLRLRFMLGFGVF